jgi:nitrate/nitrite-specific signal transduction histidine kinase
MHDAYVKSKRTKSILCYPIINQGNLTGVIYLENNLTTNAFTTERVEILKILSSQIAISVENSLLYANLEEKVEERTKDLNSALTDVRLLLNEVRTLKEHQDADYFLNTLLIEPLGQNNAVSPNITVDFFIKQKKQFVFRGEDYELGGDLNIADNIVINGRRYVVFLNGDAMGNYHVCE